MIEYIICEDPSRVQSIKHLACGRTSYNLNDVKYRYCAACNEYLDNERRKEPFAVFFDEYSFEEPSQRSFDKWFEKRNKKESEKMMKDMAIGGTGMLKISCDGKAKRIDPTTVYKAPTYRIGKNEYGDFYIEHLKCGRKSYSVSDIHYRYCGFCHKYVENEE